MAISEWFSKILRRAISWFGPKPKPDDGVPKPPAPSPHEMPPPPPPQQPSPPPMMLDLENITIGETAFAGEDDDVPWYENRWSFEREDVEQAGTFYFKRAILDELKAYFPIVRRLKHRSPDDYALFSKVGAAIMPAAALGCGTSLPALWHDKKTRPSFGGLWMFDPEEKPGFIGIKLVLFQKTRDHIGYVEPTNHDVYAVTMYHDKLNVEQSGASRWLRKALRKAGLCTPFHIEVDGAGKCRLLKELQTKYHKISYRTATTYMSGSATSDKQRCRGGGHKTRHGHATEHIPYKQWDYPDLLVSLWEDNRRQHNFLNDSVEKYAESMLCLAAGWHQGEDTGIRVNVHDGDVVATFAIDFKRSAYFFRDREATALANDGKRKRIFHIVRPHERHTATKDTFVKIHFRGLRDFVWNTYPVHITVPGWHHPDLLDMTATAELYEKDTPPLPGQMDNKEFGEALAASIAGKPRPARKKDKLMASTTSAGTQTSAPPP